MFLLGSAYPTAKVGINASMPPILFAAIRMLIVFICLLPFLRKADLIAIEKSSRLVVAMTYHQLVLG